MDFENGVGRMHAGGRREEEAKGVVYGSNGGGASRA